jgi:hypothetical protein
MLAGSLLEGGAIPVRAPTLASLTLTPFRLGVISVLSNEIANFSVPNAQRVIEENLTEAASAKARCRDVQQHGCQCVESAKGRAR